MPVCAYCDRSADLKCSSCGLVYYCGKEHQKLAWKSHKSTCVAYKIEENDHLGRYAVANRDIQPGDVIMKKTPLVAGPKMITVPICLGCHRKLQPDHVKCTKCAWGLCSAECEESKWHIHECKLLARAGVKPQIRNLNEKSSSYALILPLRALLLKNTHKKQFDELLALQSHIESNMPKPIYNFLGRTLIPLLKRVFSSSEELNIDPLQICSIFDTNAFEVRNKHVNIRAVYSMVSFLPHDCTPNTRHLCADDYSMSVIATRKICKGEKICTTYTQTLWPTLSRRTHLKTNKHFDCTCRRCSDPTELGTFAGSLKCQQCQRGLIVSTNPLDKNAAWKCQECEDVVAACQVETLNAQIRAEIVAAPRTPEHFEKLLQSFSHLLHAQNTHALEIKYALVQLYESVKCTPSEAGLQRRVELCQELLKVSSALEPGCSSFSETLENSVRAAESALSILRARTATD
ncbi:SET domain-containing protein SmydA-8-like [Atheta coriaria]|uniref:SET domain-containing protein SmydA-8-like n=1 Tax=Dalotia coriaria TaxID=877792 RepID=UPI0031F47416